jgi:hypothetical protein
MNEAITAPAKSPVADVAHPAESAPRTCLNCGAPLADKFCGACGQRDVPAYPTVRELAEDAFSELSGWDGRFAVTIRRLLGRPGMLTREFLEGRRARYISPLRLYLVASLVYFVVAAAAPELESRSGDDVTISRGLQVNVNTGGSDEATALRQVEDAPAVMRPFLKRAIQDPKGLKRGIYQTMPRVLFALLPVFALVVAAFYRGRQYPAHLYFAIHLHAFIFLALTIPEALSFTRSQAVSDGASIVVAIWIATYATLAFRHVYGGSLVRTLGKELGIATIYAVAALPGFILMVYWVSIAG